MADDLVVTRAVRIPRNELDVSFSPSGGPGGQHANRSNTRVELRFDLTSSSAFSEAQRARVLERIGPELRVVVDDERSQLRNRQLAEQRLATKLREALHVERPRRATKPSKRAKARRVDAKKRRGQVKRDRRRPRLDD
ncbi:MAG: alternative ribosome rescue aminoacyl-tRNA hydrolase ArfB [Ilumatobacter sp.]|uniref:alternative ribosome rescue aminoacyl-tRNA hydrolase ArfB n=1 Tax=Ilumatobacter sp. TaxID=1967498 RepID=UPI002624644E|nr:alternative ribosome rescue aminoacyl-tRNA hydrolase ArfB [Ilumatobacter sp.]MDJ0770276.1 alternative ribosome rescue aminoacyl-tRNA hydrolase ArfB [Ilumatobacter sp.]